MAASWTNKGVYRLAGVFRGATMPTNFYIALCTSATSPTVDTNTMSDLTEIAAGTGYTSGGYQLTKNSTDFDVYSEDDTNDYVEIQLKNIVFTASGGSIPNSGDGARWAVLTDDNATVSAREIWAYYDLTSDRTVSDGQPLTLVDMTLRVASS